MLDSVVHTPREKDVPLENKSLALWYYAVVRMHETVNLASLMLPAQIEDAQFVSLIIFRITHSQTHTGAWSAMLGTFDIHRLRLLGDC